MTVSANNVVAHKNAARVLLSEAPPSERCVKCEIFRMSASIRLARRAMHDVPREMKQLLSSRHFNCVGFRIYTPAILPRADCIRRAMICSIMSVVMNGYFFLPVRPSTPTTINRRPICI